jgi:hypothetical protein
MYATPGQWQGTAAQLLADGPRGTMKLSGGTVET